MFGCVLPPLRGLLWAPLPPAGASGTLRRVLLYLWGSAAVFSLLSDNSGPWYRESWNMNSLCLSPSLSGGVLGESYWDSVGKESCLSLMPGALGKG